MRRAPKVKTVAHQIPLRKSALTATPAVRRAFPAWIDSEDRAIALPGCAVTPRVRDALVLRTVSRRKSGTSKTPSDAPGRR